MNFTLKRIISAITSPLLSVLHRAQGHKAGTKIEQLIEGVISGKYPVLEVGAHTTSIDVDGKVVHIWTSNYPYAYGNIYKIAGLYRESKYFPLLPTAKRLHKFLKDKSKDPLDTL